jgi:zinc transport system permease protein
MNIEFLLPSLIVALLIAITAGILGPFVIWRRMAFFSDALAHSAILGTALAIIIDIKPLYGLLAYGVVLSVLLARFDKLLNISSDTLLAMLAQISLAGGLLLLGLSQHSINIERLLFGDILSVGWNDLYQTLVIASLIIASITVHWRPLLSICIDEELAETEGIAVTRYKFLLLILLLALVTIAIQLLGVLLISTLLLMPAASARNFSKTPLQMVLIAPIFAVAAVGMGLALAFSIDNISAGPAVVLCSALLWLGSNMKKSQ